MTSNSAATTQEGVIVVERVFDAPRELVWQAWTDPEHFKQWWGPKGFTSPSVEIDLQVGGKYFLSMTSPDGENTYYNTGVYREITPQERLVFTQSGADAQGNAVAMGEGMPMETEVTVTFEDLGGKTRLTLKQAGFPSNEMSEMAGEGWRQSFEKLAGTLD